MGRTGKPLSTPPNSIEYVAQFTRAAVDGYVSPSSTAKSPTGIPVGPYNGVAVITPERSTSISESIAEGVLALHGCITSTVCGYNENIGSVAPSPSDTFVVFGYSQSAEIAMTEKRNLAAQFAAGEGPNISFVVVGDPTRPNGGLSVRDPAGIVTFLLTGQRTEQTPVPSPTDTQYSTVDTALQYDGIADEPLNPLNLLADLNAYVGMVLLHPTYANRSLNEPGVIDQGKYGDTSYYLISTPVLPLLVPLQQVPIVGPVLADVLDAPLRVLVEAGYNRSISPGKPTAFDPLYMPNPVALAVNLLVAIPTGLDNGLQDMFGVRPFGTQRPGPYGVGGPAAVYLNDGDAAGAVSPDTSSPAATSQSTSRAAARRVSRGVGDPAPQGDSDAASPQAKDVPRRADGGSTAGVSSHRPLSRSATADSAKTPGHSADRSSAARRAARSSH
ncbi:PE-PPE domain-containing protein [Mycolicibacterium sarraceniae]|nr:PE-PPE domain-containing protein [Mycolicibacterium sarraceniae]